MQEVEQRREQLPSRRLWLTGRSVPRTPRDVSAPKERGAKQTAKESLSLTSFEFNALVSV
jgi:hypothetical protein